jgi:hypothetical protein
MADALLAGHALPLRHADLPRERFDPSASDRLQMG